MRILIDSIAEGKRFEAYEGDGYYKLVQKNRKASHKDILQNKDEEVIGWGLVPYFAYIKEFQPLLEDIAGTLNNDRPALNNDRDLYMQYFEIQRTKIHAVDNSLIKGEPPNEREFIPTHLAAEIRQSKICKTSIKDEYIDMYNKFFEGYVKYLHSIGKPYETRHGMIGFYLVETGQNPRAMSIPDYESFFKTGPLNAITVAWSAENIRKEIRRANYFEAGSLEYEAAKKKYAEDYDFAKLLI